MESIAYKVITDRIIQKLESGVIPWKKPWTTTSWPVNVVTGAKYRGINAVVLGSADFPSAKWLTFRQAVSLGGMVKKGEKATPVIFWNWNEKEDSASGEKSRIPFLKYYNVFNLSQCEGLEEYAEAVEENPDAQPLPACDEVIGNYLARETTLKTAHAENRAYYHPVRDLVNMPEFKRFNSREEYAATFFHELVHSTGHTSRLDRGLCSAKNPFGSVDYSKEELIAELGAAFLCGATGIDPVTLENSAAYIQGWLAALKADSRLLIQAGGKAQAAVDFILNGRPESDQAQDAE